jgi:hypothetical protein
LRIGNVKPSSSNLHAGNDETGCQAKAQQCAAEVEKIGDLLHMIRVLICLFLM